MSTCLVTGGAGFIGSHIVRGLLERGRGVRVLDNLSTGRRENLAEVADRIEWVEGDIRDAQAVAESMRGVEVVFHLAARASVPRSVAEPVSANETKRHRYGEPALRRTRRRRAPVRLLGLQQRLWRHTHAAQA